MKQKKDLPTKMKAFRFDDFDEAILDGLCKHLRVDRTSVIRIALQQMADRYGVQSDYELISLLSRFLPEAEKNPSLLPWVAQTRKLIKSRKERMDTVDRKFPKDIAKLLVKRRASSKRSL